MRFHQIPGHEEIKTNLIHAVESNQIAHALLFCGPEGCGNLAMSIAFASFVNCKNKTSTDSCGKCSSCIKIDKLIHPDLHFVYPTAGTIKNGERILSKDGIIKWRAFIKNNPYQNVHDWFRFSNTDDKQGSISKEESREIIRHFSLKPYESDYKILILWMPELLHPAAANALLKILEEPAPKTIFILVAVSIEQILPTIISRTQKFQLKKFGDDSIRNIIRAKIDITENRLSQTVFLSDGDAGKALKICEESMESHFEIFQQWMRNCYQLQIQSLIKLSETFQKMSKEDQKGFLSYGLKMIREGFIYSEKLTQLIRLEGEELKFVQNFSKFTGQDRLDDYYKLLGSSIYNIERNANSKLLFMDLSLKMHTIFLGNSG